MSRNRKSHQDRPKRGKGKKAKRQQDPSTSIVKEKDETKKPLTKRQKVRLEKRITKMVTKQAAESKGTGGKNKKKKSTPESKGARHQSDETDQPNSLYTFEKADLDLDASSDDDAAHFMLEDKDFLNEDEEEDVSEEEEEEEAEEDEEEGMEIDETAESEAEKPDGKDDLILGTDADTTEQNRVPTDLALLDSKIKDTLLVLNNFKERRNPNKARSTYVDELLQYLCSRYSYNECMIKRVFELFPNDILEFLEANEVERPYVIRTNTLKTQRRVLAQALINRGVNLDPLGDWSKVGLVIYGSQVPIGATPEYLAGHYILQGASSLIPVIALAPKPDERVLDLCAAPGGKTTYIAQLMRNTGVLIANEVNRDRAAAIIGNCHRMGVANMAVSCEDGREIPSMIHDFDRVLVDAPCSGTGVIARDPSVKTNKLDDDIIRCAQLQKQLLCAGIDACKVGGYIVYSTCSIMVEENEGVVDYALRRKNVKLQETELFGVKGFTRFKGKHFHPTMERTRRYYPHEHNMDGFFVAKLKKIAAENVKTQEIISKTNPSTQTNDKKASKLKAKKKKAKKSGFQQKPSYTDVTV